MIWEVGFWGSLGVVGYGLAGFPLLVAARSRWRRTETPSSSPATGWPSVSVVIAARNEAGCIVEKVAQLLATGYPGGRLEVIVASDGSDDGTVEAVRAMGRDEVLVLSLPRQGKAAALNEAIRRARGEVLVFTDANSRFADGALLALVRPLSDPTVGGVAGDQRYASGESLEGVSGGERAYWSFDRAIKQAESRGGSTVSATGAIYAIRRELVDEVPADVTDDFYVSTGAVAAGRRLVFAPDAVAYEAVAGSASLEFSRKVRIMTRGLTGVRRRAALLDPRRSGFYALQLFSHKVLRRLLAIPVLATMVCAIPLSRRHRVYRAVLTGQVAFVGAGGLGLLLRERPVGRWRGFSLPAYACMVNAAALRAAWNLVRGTRITSWEPPVR